MLRMLSIRTSIVYAKTEGAWFDPKSVSTQMDIYVRKCERVSHDHIYLRYDIFMRDSVD